MAKKSKPTKKAPPKNGRYHKQSKKQVEAILKAGPIRTKKTPRERPLPGMENLRIPALDEIAQNISDCRADINEARSDEAGYEQTALRLMKAHNQMSWQHAGVTLVRVPGEERLSVRTSKSKATAQVEPDEAEDENADIEAMDAGDGAEA